jgi:hypothetical protein
MYLMASTEGGISAKRIQRETRVTYKTAWRTLHQIRQLLANLQLQSAHPLPERDYTEVCSLSRNRDSESPPPGEREIAAIAVAENCIASNWRNGDDPVLKSIFEKVLLKAYESLRQG